MGTSCNNRYQARFMSIPETTSAEAYESYIGGKCLRACRGEAWRDIKACIIASPRIVDMVHLPAISEPCPARPSFRRGKATGPGLLIGSEEDHFFLAREEAFTTVAGKH